MKLFTLYGRMYVIVCCFLFLATSLSARQKEAIVKDGGSITKSNILAPILNFVVPATDPTKLSVSWSDPNPSGTVDQFYIERQVNGGIPRIVGNSFSFFYIDSDVEPGNIYTYTITAIGRNGGFSPRSNPGSGSIPFPFTAPVNLTATVNNATGVVTLNWTDNNEDETGFEVERSVNNGSFGFLKQISQTGTNISTTDNTITPGNTYSYRVRAKRNSSLSPYSNVATVATMEVVNAPSQLSGTVLSSNSIRINWRDNSTNETKFIIKRARGNGPFNVTREVSANQVTFTDTGLDPNTNYRYRVFAANTNVTSPSSNIITLRTFNSAPNAPTNFRAVFDPADIAVDFSWEDRSNNDTGHEIEYRLDTQTEWYPLEINIGGDVTFVSLPVDNLEGDMTFLVRIRATNSVGPSPWSNIAQVYIPLRASAPAAPSGLTAAYLPSTDGMVFTWTDNSDNETGFEIEFKEVSETIWNPLLEEIQSNATSLTISVANVLGDRTFDIRIRAVNSTGASPWSNVAQVYLPPNTPLSRLDDGQPLVESQSNAYPNPFSATVSFLYPWTDTPVKIIISDPMSGKTVTTLTNQHLSDRLKSEKALQWDGTDQNGNMVKNGTYIYQIRSEKGIISGRIIYRK